MEADFFALYRFRRRLYVGPKILVEELLRVDKQKRKVEKRYI